MMKTRPEEFRVSSTMTQFFSDEIIPLFEILKDEYENHYKTDPGTGEFEYETPEGKTRRQKIRLEQKPEDIITLEKLNERISGKKAFIDFYRFDSSQPANINLAYATLPLELRSFLKYKKRLLEISRYPNFIPVISIKNKSSLKQDEVLTTITDLKKVGTSSPLAIRVDIRKFDEYKHTLKQLLDIQDYFLLDIGTMGLGSVKDQIEEISKSDLPGIKILLNSPRKSSPISNADYEEEAYTDLISCEVNSAFENFGFQGFGDFGGLKNDFPTEGGPTKACALALLFDAEKNKYMSFMNPDDSLKLSGYEEVVKRILSRKEELDPAKDCPAMKIISNFGTNGAKYGSWSSWNRITLTRTIYQQYKSLQR